MLTFDIWLLTLDLRLPFRGGCRCPLSCQSNPPFLAYSADFLFKLDLFFLFFSVLPWYPLQNDYLCKLLWKEENTAFRQAVKNLSNAHKQTTLACCWMPVHKMTSYTHLVSIRRRQKITFWQCPPPFVLIKLIIDNVCSSESRVKCTWTMPSRAQTSAKLIDSYGRVDNTAEE